MKIRCTFITTTDEPNSPELAVAWDEYQIDYWQTGYDAAVRKELAVYGNSLNEVVTVDVEIDYPALCKMFAVKEMASALTEVVQP